MVGPLMPHRIVMLGVGYQALLERETRTPLHRTVSHPAPQASGRGEKGKGVTPAGRVPQRCCSALLSLPALKRQAALVQPALMLPSTLQSRETLREATSRAAGSGGRRRAVSRSVARAPAESQGPSVGAVTGLLRPGPVVWQTPGPASSCALGVGGSAGQSGRGGDGGHTYTHVRQLQMGLHDVSWME